MSFSSSPATALRPTALTVYLQALLRRKFLIIAFTIAGVICGTVVVLLKPSVYAASTTVEIQPLNESFMNMGSVDPLAGTFSSSGLNAQTQIAIIRSASIITPALDRLERETAPVLPPQTTRHAKLRARMDLGPVEPIEATREAINTASDTLSVRLLPGTRIIQMSCTSTVPDAAANFVNALAAEYISQTMEFRSVTAQRTSQWLAGQLEETKLRLAEAEHKLQAFIRASGNTFVAQPETLADAKLRQLQSELAAAQTDRISKQNRVALVRSKPAESLPAEISGPLLSQYQTQLSELRKQLAELSVTLTPKHQRVQHLEVQIKELESAQEKERTSVLRRAEAEFEASLSREKALAGAYSSQAGELSSQSGKAAEYAILKREVDMLRQSMNTILEQSNRTSVASAVPITIARVIDPARPSGMPFGPDLSRHIGSGFLGGAAFGYALAFLLEMLRMRKLEQTFGLPGHTTRVLNVPELGVIPAAGSERRTFFPLRRRPDWKPIEINSVNPMELVTWNQKPSLIAQSFRLTLAGITAGNGNGKQPRVIVITSPGPREGKTVVTSNMGVARSDSTRNVLLIDADLRRPRLHDIFKVPLSPGFSDLIMSGAPLNAAALEAAVCPTDVPGLFVLPSGAAPAESIHRIFDSPHIAEFITLCRTQFSMVLIDTSPLLHFPEARLLGRFADGVILVIRSGVTANDAALASRQYLEHDGIPILGAILNDWTPVHGKASAFDDYARYYYGVSEESKRSYVK